MRFFTMATPALLIALMALLMPGSLHAEARTINDPSDGWLNIRTGPSSRYPVLERLNNGKLVNVTEIRNDWGVIEYNNGEGPKKGWVYAPYTIPASEFLQRISGKLDPVSLAKLSEFCSVKTGNWSAVLSAVRDYCVGTYFCYDGGCSNPQELYVLLRQNESLSQGLNKLTRNGTQIRECNAGDIENSKYYLAADKIYPYLFSKDTRLICLKTIPGHELDEVIRLRQAGFAAFRLSFGAGGLPRMISITRDQFYSLRGDGIRNLYSSVITALEKVIETPCEIGVAVTCSAMISQGRIEVELLTLGNQLSGRPGIWERSNWAFYVYWNGEPENYLLYVDLPVTAIKRWPSSEGKPIGDFQPLNFDDGFENVRTAVMSEISKQIGRHLSD